MITRFRKTPLRWTLAALALLTVIGCFSLTEAQRQQPVVSEIVIADAGPEEIKVNGRVVALGDLRATFSRYRFTDECDY